MDIFSHAVAGVCTGQIFGYPVLGGIAAIVPDVVLGLKRAIRPTVLYRFTHSLLGVFYFTALASFTSDAAMFTVLFAMLSHIVLDIPTHARLWAPRLLFPVTDEPVYVAEEWEWFNSSWCKGLGLTLIWSSACLLLA